MAEKWTKTSSPDWRWMNPKPLLALNHLTVPCCFNCVSLFCLGYLVPSHCLQRKKRGCKCRLAAPSTNLKVVQEQQTRENYLMFACSCRENSFSKLRVRTEMRAVQLAEFVATRAAPSRKSRRHDNTSARAGRLWF